MRLLLDTNAVIQLLRGHAELTERCEKADWVGISVVCWIEFMSFRGLGAGDRELFEQFCERVEMVGMTAGDRPLLERTVQLRRDQALRLPDAVVLASAMAMDAVLVTADREVLRLAPDLPVAGYEPLLP